MNKIYKVVWSKAKNCYVVASELAKSHTKAPKSGVISRSVVAGVLACVLSCGAIIHPVYASYTAGGASGSGSSYTAVGEYAIADGNWSVAYGVKSRALSSGATAIGDNAYAYGTTSLSVGTLSIAHGGSSVALGRGYTSSNSTGSIAIGAAADTFANGAVAIGTYSNASEEDVISFGHKIGDSYIVPDTPGNTNADYYTVENLRTYEENLFRRVINVADGTDDHDVSTVGQTGSDLAINGTVLQLKNANGTVLDSVALPTSSGGGSTPYVGVNSSGGSNTAGEGAIGNNAIAVGFSSVATSDESIAIGSSTESSGTQSIAIGCYANALHDNDVAIGLGANNLSEVNGHVQFGGHYTIDNDAMNTVAIGAGSLATSLFSTALGNDAVAMGNRSVAIGSLSVSHEDDEVSFGYDATDINWQGNPYGTALNRRLTHVADGTADTDVSTVGQLNNRTKFVSVNGASTDGNYLGDGATGTNAIAIGKDTLASGNQSISIGTGNQVTGNNSGAFGDPNIVNGDNSYVVGNNSTVHANIKNAFVLGNNTTVSNGLPENWDSMTDAEKEAWANSLETTDVKEGVVALGNNISVSLDNKSPNSRSSISAGTPEIEHVVAVGDSVVIGEENAIGIGHSATATALNTVAMGDDAQATMEGAIAVGHSTRATNAFSNALGYLAQATGEGAGAFGQDAQATGDFTVAFGRGTRASAESATAVGNNAKAISQSSIAIGTSAVANGGANTNAVAIGRSATIGSATQGYGETLAIGSGTNVQNTFGSALGSSASVTGQKGTAVGYNASVTASNAIALGADSVANVADTVSVGSASATRKIVNVTTGTADTDASTVGQTGSDLAIDGTTLSLKNANGTVLDSVTLPTSGGGGDVPLPFSGMSDVSGTGHAMVQLTENKGLNYIGGWHYGTHGDLWFGSDDEKVSLFLDGELYQKEGTYKVLDESLWQGQGTGISRYGSSDAKYESDVVLGANNYTNGDEESDFLVGGSSGSTAVAIGGGNIASKWNSTAIGNANIVNGRHSTALGTGNVVTVDSAVAIGQGALANESNTISFGHYKNEYITSGDGTISEQATSDYLPRIVKIGDGIENHDAVTVGQMKSFVTPTSNGTFINTTNTGGQNLTALDTASKNAIKSVTIDGNMLVYTKGDNSSVSVALPTGSGSGSGATVPNGVARTTTVGSVTAFASNSTPSGYLLCDGRAVSRTQYADLFAKIGTTYGAGDGSTTFNLPNLVNRFVEGSTASGQYVGAGLPNITGWFEAADDNSGSGYGGLYGGAFNNTGIMGGNENGGPGQQNILDFDASRSNPLYGRSNTVQPESLMMQYYIKTNDDASASRYVGINSESGGFNEWGEGAVGADAIAIGKNATAETAGSTAIGYNSYAEGQHSLAVGHGTYVNADGSVAIGVDSLAYGSGSTAVGNVAIARGNSSIALGSRAYSAGLASTAVGDVSYVDSSAQHSVAVGWASSASDSDVVSFGHKSGDKNANASSDGTHFTNESFNTYDSDYYRRLINVADGTSAHDVATVGQVRTVSAGNGITVTESNNTNGSKNEAIAVKANNGITVDTNGVSAKAGTNIVVDANGINAPGNGAIAENDTGLVSGGTLYSEVHMNSDGTYVKQNRTTARNIRELDAQIASNDGDIAQNASDITNLKDLSNITEAGETVIKNLAKGSSTVVSGTNSNVVKTTVDGVDIYTVNVPGTGSIEADNTGLVSGGTVYTALQAQNVATQNSLDDKADKDASNVTDASAWASKIGTGTVADTDAKLVTGATVAGETRVAENGNYVAKNKTAGQNISALDAQVKTNANNIATNTSAINTNTTDIANLKNMSNITEAGQNVIKNLSKGSVNVVGDGKATVIKSDVSGVDTYTVSVVADGTVTENNENLVSGGTVYTAIQNAQSDLQDGLDGKLNRTLNNIRPEGQSVVRGLAQEAVKVVDGTNTTVAEGADGNAKTYAVNVTTNGTVTSGNTGIVTGDTVYQAIQDAITGSESGTGTALAGKANVDASNVTDAQVWADKLGTGTVNVSDTKLVTGKTVAEETRVASDGNYVQKNNSAGSNLSALDTQVKVNADAIATNTSDITNLKNLSNISDAGKTVIKNLSKGAINVTGSGKATVTKSEVSGVDTYNVEVLGDGTVAENNEGLVTGGTVHTAIQNAITASETDITTQLNRKANRDASNITNVQPWAEKLGIGSVDDSNINLVSGKTVAGETRVASDGSYVLQTNTAGQNITALDVQAKANADAISNLQSSTSDALNDKANVGLDNITPAGEDVVRTLAKDAVKVVAGTATTVTEGTDGNTKTYSVNVVKDGVVADGNMGIVTGDAVHDAIESAIANSEGDTATALEGKANVDASNVTNSSAWASKLDTGTITNGNGELVSGGKVYTAIENAKAEIGTEIDGIRDNLSDGLATKANVSLDNISADGTNVIRNVTKNAVKVANGSNTTVATETDASGNVTYKVTANATGTVAEGNTGLVDGGTVYSAIETATNDITSSMNDGIAEKANKDASNVSSYTAEWGQAIGTGTVANRNGELVTGDTVYREVRPTSGNYISATNTTAQNLTALDTQVKTNTDAISELQTNTTDALDSKANVDLDNLSNTGKDAVRDLAKESVKVVNGVKTTVTEGTDGNSKTYAVNVVADGVVADNNTGLVTGGVVKEAIDTLSTATDTKLEDYAKKDASNVTDASLWGTAIGTGTVIDGNGELVTGGTVSTAIKNAVNGINDSLTDKANSSLDNISADGQTVIKDLAKGAVKVVAGDKTTITEGTDGDSKTYAVNVTTDGTVSEGNEGVVTGGTVYTAIQDAVTTAQADTATALEEKANKDASNITDAEAWGEKIATGSVAEGDVKAISGGTVYTALEDMRTELTGSMDTALAEYAKKDASNIQVADWASKLGTGTVSASDTNLVTGATVYGETRVARDGNYVKAGEAANTNLMNLDTGLQETREIAEAVASAGQELSESAVRYDNADKATVTLGGENGTVITNLKDGELSENSKDAVTGKQLYETNQNVQENANNIQSINDRLGTVETGNYISEDKTFGENLGALDTQVKTNADNITELQNTVSTLNTNMDSKVDTDLGNLSEEGEAVVRDLAQKSVEATSNDGSVIITKTDAEGIGNGRTFDFAVKKDGIVAEGNNDIVTGGAVYQAIQEIEIPREVKYVGVNSNDENDVNVHGGGATGEDSIAIGHGATASGVQTIAIGKGNQVSGNHSGAIGDPNDVSGDASYALGNDNTVSGDNTFAIGNNIQATGNNSVVLGNGSDGSMDNVVSVGAKNKERKIVHVANGEIAEGSTDAVNGGQLYQVEQDFINAQNIDVDKWTDKLATGSISNGDGGLVTGGQVYNAFSNMSNAITELIGPDASETQIRIGGGSSYDGVDTINVAKSNGEGRVITGVITDVSDATSAANVGYVNAVGQNLANATNNALNRMDTKVNKVGANAAAMASLEPPPMDGDEKWAFSAAVGHYEGETAGAIGAFYRPQDNVIVNVRGSMGNGEEMIGAGVGVALQRGASTGITKAKLAKAVNNQAQVIQQLRADQAIKDAKIKEMEERMARMEEMLMKQNQSAK